MAKKGIYEGVLEKKVFEFSAPFSFEGEPERTSLPFDLSTLTGQDMIEAQEDFDALGNSSGVVELNKRYQAFLAARVAKVTPDYIMALPVRDFSSITLLVQRFLLSGG